MGCARAAVFLALGTSACALQRQDPSVAARALARETATAIERGELAAIGVRILAPSTKASIDRQALFASEKRALLETAAHLRAAAYGRALVYSRVRLQGPLGTEVQLERQEEGWRVDPETLGVRIPTPVAAVEQLILALERLESDPALALLSSALREAILGACRERVQGLRIALPRLMEQRDGRLTLHLSYGEGLFLDLRLEAGAWHIEDFN